MPPLTIERRAFTTTSFDFTALPTTSTPPEVKFLLPYVEGINSSQSWYWSSEWQARACEAQDDVRLGRYRDFDTIDDFIASLDDPVDDE